MLIWTHFFRGAPESFQLLSREQLSDAGVQTRPLEVLLPDGPGVIFFERMHEELFEIVRSISGGGRERVLAVGTGSEAIGADAFFALLSAGAADVIRWQESSDPARDIAARFDRWEEVDQIVSSELVRENLVGQSAVWRSVLRQVVEAARFSRNSMLIEGESGTGKELAARLVHTLTQHQDKGRLIVVDCTTIVPTLSGSEFFGHERGAFTGAVAARDGAFALADGGTLFLDEIGELPGALQAELLRVVQEGTFKRVGSNQWQRTNFRLICATNCNLMTAVAEGRFRRDLYYRIAGWNCRLPALRERSDDILPLARHFIAAARGGADRLAISQPVEEYLLRRQYPGNVRDLKQLVNCMTFRHAGQGALTVGDVPEVERPASGLQMTDWRDAGFEAAVRRAVSLGVGLKSIGHAATDAAMRIALTQEGGNLQRAARKLGVTDRALQMRRAALRAGHA